MMITCCLITNPEAYICCVAMSSAWLAFNVPREWTKNDMLISLLSNLEALYHLLKQTLPKTFAVFWQQIIITFPMLLYKLFNSLVFVSNVLMFTGSQNMSLVYCLFYLFAHNWVNMQFWRITLTSFIPLIALIIGVHELQLHMQIRALMSLQNFPLEEGSIRRNTAMRICSAAMAGIFATLFTYPIDVVRAKLTVQEQSCKSYNGMHQYRDVYTHC